MIKRGISYIGSFFNSTFSFIGSFFNSGYYATDRGRGYYNTLVGRNNVNEVLPQNLGGLCAICRDLERKAPLAKAVVEGWKASLVGAGIGIEPTLEDEEWNDLILEEFNDWCENACVDKSSLWSLQWQSVGEVCCAGAALIRVVVKPDRIEEGFLPICLMPLEVEMLSDSPLKDIKLGNTFVKGIELDKFGCPVSYHILNNNGVGEVVSAKEIIHVYEQRRPCQAHGEPVLAVLVERVKQDDDLILSEQKSAKVASTMAVLFKMKGGGNSLTNKKTASADAASREITMENAQVIGLEPGEDASIVSNNRPNQSIAQFRGTIRGDIAAGCRVSQLWLDRDASRANYNSARMDMLMQNLLMNPLKEIFGKKLAGRVYEVVLPYIFMKLRLGVPTQAQVRDYRLLPDMPDYVEPLRDAQASVALIENNLSTYEDELSKKGKQNLNMIIKKRKRENEKLEEAGLARKGVAEMNPALVTNGQIGQNNNNKE
jgi:lambda family phage portal protein